VRTVSVKLMADAADFSRAIRGAGRDVKTLHGELAQASRAGRLDSLTDSATGFGVGLLGAGAAAVKFSMDFEKQMSAVKAATHGSAAEMDQLRRAALEAGADTQFSATQAAKGVEELSKAGVKTADILGGGLKGALDLAAAGELDVGEAAETAASALTQFKLKGSDVPHVADLLAAAAGKAQGTVHDMSQALNQAGLVAAGTGLTIEDTTGTLAAFASAGLTGSDAGTSFKTMLQMLQAPSGKTKELMDELGISAYDTSGQFIGITALAGQLKSQLGSLTPELRANAMAQIFGADAVRASTILYEQGAEGIQTWINKTDDAGYAAETAAIKTDNLAGDLERLKGSLETLAIQSGGGANEGLRVLAKSANSVVDQFGQLPAGISGTMTVLAVLGGALTLGAVGWTRMRRANADALEELRSTGPAGQKAATGLQATTKWAGRAAVAFAATQVAAAGVAAAFGSSVSAQTEAYAKSLSTWATSGQMAGEAARLLGDDFEHLGYDLGTLDSGFWTGLGNGVAGTVESLTGLGSVADESLTKAKERLTALDGALTAMVQAGNGVQAAQVFDKLAAEAAKSGVSVDELKKGLPQYTGALQTAGAQSVTAAGQVGQVGEAAETAEDKVEQLEQAFEDLFEQYMTSDQAAIAYKESVVATNKELKDGTKTLSDNSEEGRANRKAVLDRLDAINDLRGATIAETGDVKGANKAYRDQIDALAATMRKMGFTRKEIDALIGKYRKIPEDVETKVSVTGEGPVIEELERLNVIQQALKSGKPIGALNKVLRDKRMATGGEIHGPGTPTSDEVPIWASPGEWVIKEKSARKLGSNVMRHINDFGELPAFAAGGRVGWPYPVTAAMTKIPSEQEVINAVRPEPPSGGRTSDWIVNTVRARFPGIDVLSKDRPGARTLSGNVSYHARGRAVDFEPSKALAAWWDANYRSRTKELISPYQQYNIHNGRRHRYTGAVWNQHNFAGGNAHDHIAMRLGGVINEPVWGVGASGRSYSFGEGGIPETVIPGTPHYLAERSAPQVVVQVAAPAPTAAHGGPLVGPVIVQDRADADMIANQLQFRLQGV
jgi:TP901 family phage tail tape measure protein